MFLINYLTNRVNTLSEENEILKQENQTLSDVADHYIEKHVQAYGAKDTLRDLLLNGGFTATQAEELGFMKDFISQIIDSFTKEEMERYNATAS